MEDGNLRSSLKSIMSCHQPSNDKNKFKFIKTNMLYKFKY